MSLYHALAEPRGVAPRRLELRLAPCALRAPRPAGLGAGRAEWPGEDELLALARRPAASAPLSILVSRSRGPPLGDRGGARSVAPQPLVLPALTAQALDLGVAEVDLLAEL